MQVPSEVREGIRSSETGVAGGFDLHVGTGLRSSGRAANALNHRPVSSAPACYYFKNDLFIFIYVYMYIYVYMCVHACVCHKCVGQRTVGEICSLLSLCGSQGSNSGC